MAEVESLKALLVMAVQDLFDGEEAMAQRLPVLRSNASDASFAAIVEKDRERSGSQRDALAAIARSLGSDPNGGPNIWIRAILDDSDNDADTIARGELLDIALIGALRKAKQSERVSYETALALARRLDLAEVADRFARIRDEEQSADHALARALERLSGARLESSAEAVEGT